MRWLAATVVALLVTTGAQATTLQALLIRASQDAPSDTPLKEIEPQLKRQFGYHHYRLLGSKHDTLKLKTLQQFDVGEGFTVLATLRSTTNKVHELDIQWMAGKTKLVATTVKMSHGSHVFIKGPAVGNDWIVLSLTVMP
jgi:opacity protein-like surface antigen